MEILDIQFIVVFIVIFAGLLILARILKKENETPVIKESSKAAARAFWKNVAIGQNTKTRK